MVSDRESLTHIEHNVSGLLSSPRVITLLGSILVALSAGTNYVFSAYAPQLGARLHISHTQLNVVGLAANCVFYLCSEIMLISSSSRYLRVRAYLGSHRGFQRPSDPTHHSLRLFPRWIRRNETHV